MTDSVLKPVIIGMMSVVLVFLWLHVDHMRFSDSVRHSQNLMRSESLLSKDLDLQIEEAINDEIINYDSLNSAVKEYGRFIEKIKSDPDQREFFKELLRLSEKKFEAVDSFKRANALLHNSLRYVDHRLRKTFIIDDVRVHDREQRVKIDRLLEDIIFFQNGRYELLEGLAKRAEVIDALPEDDASVKDVKSVFRRHLPVILAEGRKLGQTVMKLRILNQESSVIITKEIVALEKKERSVDKTFSTIIKITIAFSILLLSIFYLLIDKLLKQERQIREKIERATSDLRIKNEILEESRKTIDQHVIISKTDTRGIITYASKAFCDISGYSEAELLGKRHSIVRHEDMPTSMYDDLWMTIRSTKTWHGEIKNRRKDGTSYWVDVTIRPDLDKEGHIIGYSAIRQDITAKKELEAMTVSLEQRVIEEMKKNKEKSAQMIQQSRLAQMGEMISMIAHQWRQPLASISAISGTLVLDVMMENYKKAFFEERLETISALSQHLSSTIDDFRDFFKEAKERTAIGCSQMLEESLAIIEPTLISKDIHVNRDYDSDQEVYTYPSEVKQVILNIIKNAEDALLEKNYEESLMISISTHHTKDDVYISIEDNAGGIAEEIIEKIFDPYFSTKSKKDGTGLGLYMSKTIIEDHCKGQISVENTAQGARFEIILPTGDR